MRNALKGNLALMAVFAALVANANTNPYANTHIVSAKRVETTTVTTTCLRVRTQQTGQSQTGTDYTLLDQSQQQSANIQGQSNFSQQQGNYTESANSQQSNPKSVTISITTVRKKSKRGHDCCCGSHPWHGHPYWYYLRCPPPHHHHPGWGYERCHF